VKLISNLNVENNAVFGVKSCKKMCVGMCMVFSYVLSVCGMNGEGQGVFCGLANPLRSSNERNASGL
jgi:hypothetical protein